MGIRIGIGSLKIGQGSTGVDWSSYWTQLISATVENAAPTNVVLTFPTAQTSLLATDITCTVNGVSRAVSSASWTGNVWTVVLESAIIYGDLVALLFGKSGGISLVTNNVLADYYINAAGSNTSPYDTPAKASTTLKTVLDYIQTNEDGTGCTISIGAGTFSSANDVIALNHANKRNITIIGAGAGITIISPSAGNCVNASNCDGAKIKRMTLKPITTANAYFTANTTDTVELEDVDLVSPIGHNNHLFSNVGNTTNCKRCNFYHQYGAGSKNPVYMTGDSAGTFTNCISVAAGHTRDTQSWSIATSGNVDLINCNILDSGGWGVYFNGAGTFNVTNCIVSGSNGSSAAYPIGRAAGNLTVTNTLVIATTWDGDAKWISGTYTDGGGNLFTSVNPKFTNYPRKGFLLPRIDDSGDFAYAQSVETILAAKSMYGSYVLEQKNWNTANNAALRTMVAAGVLGVESHSYSHSNLSLTGKLFDVTKAAETITIDRTADTITLSGGGTVSGFKAKTLAAIKAELEGLGATVTGTAIYSTDDSPTVINGDALGEVIANGAGVNQIDLLIDATAATGLYKSEIADPKTWLADIIINGAGDVIDGQTGAAYVCRAFGFPYNASSANARAAVIASGYACGSSGKIGGAGTVADVPYTGDIDMFAIVDVGASVYLKGVNEANVRYNARALAFAAAHTGLVIGVLAHSTAELSLDEWGWVTDEWANYGTQLHVISRQQFRDYIANPTNGWTDDTDGTFSRVYVDGDADYELEAGSPCSGAGSGGVNIGAN